MKFWLHWPTIGTAGSSSRRQSCPSYVGCYLQTAEPCASDRFAPVLLFAYGTLGPAAGGTSAQGWVADAVRGRLFDVGPHPVLIDWDDPHAGWVEGHARPVDECELLERLDPYEGVDKGLFRRVEVITREGRLVWLYVYPHPLPRGARGPLASWSGPRVAEDP